MAAAAHNPSRFAITVSLQNGVIEKEASGAISASDAEAFADAMVSAALAIRGLARELAVKQTTIS